MKLNQDLDVKYNRWDSWIRIVQGTYIEIDLHARKIRTLILILILHIPNPRGFTLIFLSICSEAVCSILQRISTTPHFSVQRPLA